MNIKWEGVWKCLEQCLAHTSIQPVVTIIMCMSSLLFELLSCSTEVATQIFAELIIAKRREPWKEPRSWHPYFIISSFSSVTLRFGVPGSAVEASSLLLAQMSLFKGRVGGKSSYWGPLGSSEPLRGIPSQCLVPSLFLPSPTASLESLLMMGTSSD